MEAEKLVIVKDSREPKEKYNFYGKQYKDVFHIGGHPLIDNLSVGDYSVSPYEDTGLMIERKTMADFVSSFATGKKDKAIKRRDEFRAMWERARKVKCKYLMVEGVITDILSQNFRSEFNPNSLMGSLMSWSIRYGFSFFFVRDENEGQSCVYWLCREFLRLKNKGEI